MSTVQNNTRSGLLPITAGEDLTGKEGRLIEIRNSSGVTVAATPAAVGGLALYVLENGGAIGESVDVLPLDPARNMRAVAKGVGAAGDVLVLADPATAGDKGKLRKIPATAGSYFSPGIAEEGFVDGQNVRFRPWPRLIVVP